MNTKIVKYGNKEYRVRLKIGNVWRCDSKTYKTLSRLLADWTPPKGA